MNLRINVGSAKDYREGWVNIEPCPGFKSDFLMVLPGDKLTNHFGAGTASEVYAKDIMEHFFRWEGIEFLKDCYRVLAAHGTLRIVTPDLGKVVTDKALPLKRKLELIHGAQGQPGLPDEGEQMMKAWREHPEFFTHKYTWTEDELTSVMVSEGFWIQSVDWLSSIEMDITATKLPA